MVELMMLMVSHIMFREAREFYLQPIQTTEKWKRRHKDVVLLTDPASKSIFLAYKSPSQTPPSAPTKSQKTERCLSSFYHKFIYIPVPASSSCLVMFTVSPNMSYRGFFRPTTPATQGPGKERQ